MMIVEVMTSEKLKAEALSCIEAAEAEGSVGTVNGSWVEWVPPVSSELIIRLVKVSDEVANILRARDITPEVLDDIQKAEELNKAEMSKKQKRLRRLELSDPSTISANLASLMAEAIPATTIIDKIKDLLKATHVTKGGHYIDDNRAQESAVKLWLAYVIGLPTQRIETINVNVEATVAELKERVDQNPALKERLRKITGGETTT